MKNRYLESEARAWAEKYPGQPPEAGLRVYTSRLLGREPELVLHGGGNTSVKITIPDLLGRDVETVIVKGSGIDLARIEPEGFTMLDLAALARLKALATLSDEDMANQLATRKLRARDPDPSVDALAHVFLPHRWVDHTHADAILTLGNQEQGAALLEEALGDRVGILPYTRPGFPLARQLALALEARPDLEALVVLGHGIFTFGDEAKIAYDRMIECVSRAEALIEAKRGTRATAGPLTEASIVSPGDAARFTQTARGACSYLGPDGRRRRFLAEIRSGPDMAAASLYPEAPDICASGVLTPDHVIRTKNRYLYIEKLPESDGELGDRVRRAVADYVAEYDRCFEEQCRLLDCRPSKIDPYPRVFLVAGLGLVALGPTRREARIAADIAQHTLRAKLQGLDLGTYTPIGQDHVFELEYWGLQQKKLGQAPPPLLQGQAALVTGGGGAIGYGVADRLLDAGATVALADLDPVRLDKVRGLLETRYGPERIETLVFDVTDDRAVSGAFADVSRRLGGLDLVVPNAGLACVGRIEDLDRKRVEQVMAVNLGGTFNVLKAAIPVFRRQGTGGNIVLVSTKNVFDPGAAFGAYSASKAAAHQLARIAALELAEIGVRVNMLNPDAVFGDQDVASGLWELIGPERMQSRGLDPEGLQEYYRQRNLLKTRVTAEHVGNAVVFFAAEMTPTTGATLPVDGGVPGAFPR
ncbi:MAG: bifunctional aldolase/short-chain dehydrogenase [Proteobacteria bacterium]|nr:bifunctional aldolase/short-chain dehydrogenase [Pseudomonadota bacterium]